MASGLSNDNIKAAEAGAELAVKPPKVKPYIKVECGLRELRSPRMWRDVGCEVFAVTVLIAFVVGFVANFRTPENPTTTLLLVGFGAGVQVFVLIETFAHIQHAAMNPAVVVFFTLTGKMSIVRGFLMVCAECTGSMLGTILVYSCAPPVVRENFRPVGLHEGIAPWQGVILECLVTTSLIMLVAGATDARNRKVNMPGLPVGMSIAAGILMGGHFTGGTMNPMIVFGPAVVTGIWTHQWVYWVGPVAGGFLGTILYHFFTYEGGIFKNPGTQEESKEGDYVACATKEHEDSNGILSSTDQL